MSYVKATTIIQGHLFEKYLVVVRRFKSLVSYQKLHHQ